MNIEMFIKFPGILITIGVVLLLLSIIIGFIAYKKDKNTIGASSLSNDVLSVDEIDDEKPPIENTQKIKIEEPKEEEKGSFTFPKEEEIEDIKTEPIPIINQIDIENKDEVTVVPVMEKVEPVITEPIVEKVEEIKSVETEEPIKEEVIEQPKTTLIYGGVEPTKQFNFSFNSEKGTYEEKKPVENIVEKVEEKPVEVVQRPIIEQPTEELQTVKEEKPIETKQVVVEDEEDIEVL